MSHQGLELERRRLDIHGHIKMSKIMQLFQDAEAIGLHPVNLTTSSPSVLESAAKNKKRTACAVFPLSDIMLLFLKIPCPDDVTLFARTPSRPCSLARFDHHLYGSLVLTGFTSARAPPKNYRFHVWSSECLVVSFHYLIIMPVPVLHFHYSCPM